MVGAEFLEKDGVGFFPKLLSLGQVFLGILYRPNVVVAGGYIGMIRTQLL